MQKTAVNRRLETFLNPSVPGILVFDRENKLVFMNLKAQDILTVFTQSHRSEQNKNRMIPNMAHQFCDRLKNRITKTDKPRTVSSGVKLPTYVLREVPLQDRQRTKIRKTRFLMIIVEEASHLSEFPLKNSKKLNN